MDDATLSSLRRALEATPDNFALRGVLIETLLAKGDAVGAYGLLGEIDPEELEGADRLVAAKVAFGGRAGGGGVRSGRRVYRGDDYVIPSVVASHPGDPLPPLRGSTLQEKCDFIFWEVRGEPSSGIATDHPRPPAAKRR